jgi:hypothetical protein
VAANAFHHINNLKKSGRLFGVRFFLAISLRRTRGGFVAASMVARDRG